MKSKEAIDTGWKPGDKGNKSVDQLLQDLAELYRERNNTYGDAYKRHGAVLFALFNEELVLKGKDDFNRFGILNIIISKLERYCYRFREVSDKDSPDDSSVYWQMLKELDNEIREKK